MARILLVDDDQELCTIIVERLSVDGHEIDLAHAGDSALEFIAVGAYDVIVLDWDLPRVSGVTVLRNYRESGGQTPIIMLTGKASDRDKEEGLDSGADDYLTKPFSTRELAARIRALTRRTGSIPGNTIRLEKLELDLRAHKVMKNGVELHLQPRDFALLEFFMKNPGVMFSADALITKVWGLNSNASIDGLRTAIKRIRKQIDDGDDESQSLIETVPRVGYRMKSLAANS